MQDIIELEDDHREIAPGFFEIRRRMFRLPVSMAVALVFGRNSKAFAHQAIETKTAARSNIGIAGPLSWDSFVEQCVPIAGELHKDSSASGQEAYLHWIASMISRARAAEIPKAKLGKFEKLEPAVHFGVGFRGRPFFIVEWQLEPGAILPPHCHPNASVCTVGLEGEARIRNFEVVGSAPEFESRRTFAVRETHNELIGPGRINTLSSYRDNIHTFRAGKSGARGIDISTYHGPDVGFSFVEIETTPKEQEGRIFEAVWKGQTP